MLIYFEEVFEECYGDGDSFDNNYGCRFDNLYCSGRGDGFDYGYGNGRGDGNGAGYIGGIGLWCGDGDGYGFEVDDCGYGQDNYTDW